MKRLNPSEAWPFQVVVVLLLLALVAFAQYCYGSNAVCTKDSCPGESYEVAMMMGVMGSSAASCTPSTPASDNSEIGYQSVGGTVAAEAIFGKICG